MEHAAHIDILNICTAGKMLDIGGTIEHGVNLLILHRVEGAYLRHIPFCREEPGSYEFFISLFEIVEQHRLKPLLHGRIVSFSQEAVYLRFLRLQKFPQNVDAKESGSSGKQHIADGLRAAFLKCLECVACKQLVDCIVIILGQVFKAGLFSFLRAFFLEHLGQASWSRMGEYISISNVISCFCCRDDDAGHHKRGSAQIKETVGCSHSFKLEHIREYLAEHFLIPAFGSHILSCSCEHGIRQGFAVNLSVRSHGKRIHLKIGRRNHILGQGFF